MGRRTRFFHLLLHSICCLPSLPLIFTEDEDSEGPRSGESRLQHSPNQSYLCIPFPRGEDGEGPSSDGVHEEPTPVNSATSTPQLTPTNSLKRGGTHHRRCEVALLGCGAVLAATGLGFDLLEAGKCQLLPPEEPEPPAREEKKRREGLFQRASRPRRSTSPPSRKLFKKEEPMLLLGDPSASLTLLSLSSISECNSTRSLLRSDSDEIVVYEMPVSPVEAPPLSPCTHNPLVNVRVERFKRDPNQSLTPTHVTLTAPAQPSGHRRTPSDGALKPAVLLASRSPSSNGLSPSPGAGESGPPPLFFFLPCASPRSGSTGVSAIPPDSAHRTCRPGAGAAARLAAFCPACASVAEDRPVLASIRARVPLGCRPWASERAVPCWQGSGGPGAALRLLLEAETEVPGTEAVPHTGRVFGAVWLGSCLPLPLSTDIQASFLLCVLPDITHP